MKFYYMALILLIIIQQLANWEVFAIPLLSSYFTLSALVFLVPLGLVVTTWHQ